MRRSTYLFLSPLTSVLTQLDNANEAISAKEATIVDLECQVSETKSSLESALADIQEKQANLEGLERAKAAAEQLLEEVQAKLQTLQDERDADDSAALLQSVEAEVCQFAARSYDPDVEKMPMGPSCMRQRNSFGPRKGLSRLFNHG